jgi:putative thioredoxin
MNFDSDVLRKSYEKPVVVDFWAPWCGPCRMLSPVIEELAEEHKEKWSLVKVNTEEEEDLALRYNIRSIPNVKMFYQGEVVAEFAGALPKRAILQWLDENLPDERKKDMDALLARLQNGGAMENVLTDLKKFVAENPGMTEARLALAVHLATSEPETALELVAPITMGDKFYETAEDIRTLVRLMTFASNSSPAALALDRARNALKAQDEEEAIRLIIEATTIDRSYDNDLPRKAAIALFRLWGQQHSLTKNYRWQFDMALY